MSQEIVEISSPKVQVKKSRYIARPKASKTLITQKIRDTVARIVVEEAEPVIRAQVKAAIGGFSTMTVFRDKNGEIEKTIQAEETPNHQAAKLLLEFAGAKPADKVQHSGAIGLVALVRKLETEDLRAEEGGD